MSRARALLIAYGPALGAGLLALIARVDAGGFGESFGGGHFGANGAAYHSRMARAFCHWGFAELRYAPALFVLPTEPPEPHFYFNHPPPYFLVHGLLYATFGPHPLVLQVAQALIFVLTGLAVAAIFGCRRPVAAAVAGVVANSIPAGSHFGFMVCSFTICILFSALAWRQFLRWSREPSPRELLGTAAIAVTGGLFDWWSFLLLPAMVVKTLLDDRRHARTVLATCVVVVIATLLAVIAHRVYVLGDLAGAFRSMAALFAHAAEHHETARAFDRDWWERIGSHLLQACTWIGLAIIALGLFFEPRWHRTHGTLALLAGGLTNVFLLPGHARHHDFFVQPMLLPAAVAAGLVVERTWLRSGTAVRAGLGTVAVACVLSWIAQSSELFRPVAAGPPHPTIARGLEQVATTDDVVLTDYDAFLTAGYTDIAIVGLIDTPARLRAFLEFLPKRPLRGRILFVRFDQDRGSELARALEQLATGTVHGPIVLHDLTRARRE